MTDFERGFISKCAEAGIPHKISESMLKTAIEHAVVDGDTLESLSERYGVPARALAYVNRRVLGGGQPAAGMTLHVPDTVTRPASAPAAPAAPAPARARRTRVPRGYTANNPGNIRSDGVTQWEGANLPAEGEFLTFDTPHHGIRALARILRNYGRRHGIDTVEGAVGRYAPPSENDTDAYAAGVRSLTGIRPNQEIDLTDVNTVQRLVPAFMSREIGPNYAGTYSPSVVSNAVNAAFN